MECLIANVDHIKFDIEVALDEQYGALPLPFPGMDSKIEKFSNYKLQINMRNVFRINCCSMPILFFKTRLPERSCMPF